MTTRRGFLRLLGAGSAGALVPSLSWADMGAPAYLAAARRPAGDFALFGLDATGQDLFAVPLPARAHATAVHPRLAQAVVFARRPGTFAIVLDCGTGRVLRELETPAGFYLCGHGAYDATGAWLYTTETDTGTGDGCISVWDATNGFARAGVLPSGGIGPHECLLMPGGRQLAIGNGALETGPDGSTDPASVALMRPNLAYLDLRRGTIDQVLELPEPLRKNSIRHLAVRPDGLLAFAMQWHGDDTETPPLLGLHRFGADSAQLLAADEGAQRALKGYAGSIAFSGDGLRVAISSPLGGLADMFDVAAGEHAGRYPRPDLCGLAAHGAGFAATTGQGDWLILDGADGLCARPSSEPGRAWDNHMTALHT